jgi:hypothetical protein
LGEEVFIGGTTSYDAKAKTLDAVMREWTSTRSFQERCDKLEAGFQDTIAGWTRLKRKEKAFPKGTVLDDGARDTLLRSLGDDWFLAFPSDDVRD